MIQHPIFQDNLPMRDDKKFDASNGYGKDEEGNKGDGRSRRRHRKKKEKRQSRKSWTSRDNDNDDDSLSSSSSRDRRRSRGHKKSSRRKANNSSSRRRRYSSSSGDSTSSASSSSDSGRADRRQRKRHRRRKDKKKKSKKRRKDRHDEASPEYHPPKSSRDEGDKNNNISGEKFPAPESAAIPAAAGPEVPNKEATTEKSKRAAAMAPMSREQYNELQSQVREVYDEESGRYRLVRGTGEIIERIVSRDDHQSINQRATRGDGASFSRHIMNRATFK